MHRRLRVVAPLAAVAAVIFSATAPAWADGSGDAWNNGTSIGASASTAVEGGTADATGGGGGAPTCTFAPLGAADQQAAADNAANGWGPTNGTGPGTWYREICSSPNGTSTATIVWAPTGPAVNVNALAQQAAGNAAIPSPAVRMNPAVGQEQVVHVVTWLWIDRTYWVPVSASASAGGVTVTATASPQSVTWNMGDGSSVTCNGPGTAYDPSRSSASQSPSCSYTYNRSSADAPGGDFALTATITYHVTWTAAGAPGGGDLGVATRSTTVPVRVAEIQAINRPNNQGN